VDTLLLQSTSAHTELWRRSFALVEELSALSDSELAACLEGVRADDPALAASVARMLGRTAHNERTTSAVLNTTIPLPRGYAAGDAVGAYTLEKKLALAEWPMFGRRGAPMPRCQLSFGIG
jgi:hypothetical protein